MTVNAPTTNVTAETATICEGESYTWSVNGVTYSNLAAGVYNYADTVVVDACSINVTTLALTVNASSVTTNAETATICENEAYTWSVNGVTYENLAAGVYNYADTVEDGCSMAITTLQLTVNALVVEEITVTECHAYTWRGETYTVSGDYTYEGDCYKEILHLTIEGQIPENNPELAEAEAVAKYGNRLVMLHLNNFVEKYGWTPAAGDVMWYQVNGDVDTSWEVENDTPLGTGYYIDSQEGYTGEVYAVINASTEDKCQNIYRTKVIALVPAGQAPKLMPTIARPSEDLHLMNLNPSNVTEVRVFNTSGELMATYQAEEASEFVFKAATLPGYYMVEVQHNGEQTTLRYIVK